MLAGATPIILPTAPVQSQNIRPYSNVHEAGDYQSKYKAGYPSVDAKYVREKRPMTSAHVHTIPDTVTRPLPD